MLRRDSADDCVRSGVATALIRRFTELATAAPGMDLA